MLNDVENCRSNGAIWLREVFRVDMAIFENNGCYQMVSLEMVNVERKTSVGWYIGITGILRFVNLNIVFISYSLIYITSSS